MINQLIILAIKTIRPLLGPASCKYSLSCTHYAYDVLKQKSLIPALWAILKRVLSCW